MYNKILLTGINGQVGHALQTILSRKQSISNPALSNSLISLDRNQLDLSKPDEIRRIIQTIKPDLIINPAAYTAVDKAESEQELAYAVNATAPQIMAEEAARVGARLIHFSTDYVYSGNKTSPYLEDDATEPLSVYGKSKLAGEQAIQAVGLSHFIFRTSWVYGLHGKNFLKTILRLASEREELRIVADQFGAPTTNNSIAEAVVKVLHDWKSETTGVYHMVNQGETSWHGFATAIVEEYSSLQVAKGWMPLKVKPEDIHAITTQDYPTPASRPANSCLEGRKLERDFLVTLPEWRSALAVEMSQMES